MKHDRSLIGDNAGANCLEELIQRVEQAGASDVHLHRHGTAARVLFRLDGLMTPAAELPEQLAELVFGRTKYLARLKTCAAAIYLYAGLALACLGFLISAAITAVILWRIANSTEYATKRRRRVKEQARSPSCWANLDTAPDVSSALHSANSLL